MQEFKGTKGSWSYDEVTGTIRGDGGLLAELLINGSEDHNGVLMASAPELLEALLGYMSAVERMNQAMKDGFNVQGAISALAGYEDMAHSVINKALGK
ncbi:hypothetical protein [Klebsiella michiganensis]|uniref:hypothetical protein n=1 Tax=Klebsiella michiganensis TaxID=1134687 RepID=UPI0039C160F2